MIPSFQWSEMATQFLSGGVVSLVVVALAAVVVVQTVLGFFRANVSKRKLRSVDSRLRQVEMQFDQFMMQRLRLVNESASTTVQTLPVRDRLAAVQDIHAA